MNILTQRNYLAKNLDNALGKKAMVSSSFETPMIGVAALELNKIPLSQSLINFATQAEFQGYKKIKIIPLFLAPGTHVQLDIPEEVARGQQRISSNILVELSTYIGKYSEIVPLLATNFQQLGAETKILLAHGTRLAEGQTFYQNLAYKLDAELAYWSMEPQLTSQIESSIASGVKKIAILPYFLFPGRIIQAIAQEVTELRLKFPGVELLLGEPLGATPAMAKLIAAGA